MVQGRKPDLKRWARVERLRKTGLSLAQIGCRLGMTAKAVHRTLRTIEQARVSPRSVPCSACRRDIVSAGALASDRGSALCLACWLGERPLPGDPVAGGRKRRSSRGRCSGTRVTIRCSRVRC